MEKEKDTFQPSDRAIVRSALHNVHICMYVYIFYMCTVHRNAYHFHTVFSYFPHQKTCWFTVMKANQTHDGFASFVVECFECWAFWGKSPFSTIRNKIVVPNYLIKLRERKKKIKTKETRMRKRSAYAIFKWRKRNWWWKRQ